MIMYAVKKKKNNRGRAFESRLNRLKQYRRRRLPVQQMLRVAYYTRPVRETRAKGSAT